MSKFLNVVALQASLPCKASYQEKKFPAHTNFSQLNSLAGDIKRIVRQYIVVDLYIFKVWVHGATVVFVLPYRRSANGIYIN